MELTVLLLVWNEADNLTLLLVDLRRVLEELAIEYEMLVVDGGSSDGSREVAESHGARVLRQRRRGYGNALKEGVAAARGDYVLTMDADYSHEPSFVRHLWEARSDSDLIIASRYVPGGRAQMPFFRYLLSRSLNSVYRFLLDLPSRDLSSGFRLYRLAALRNIESVGCNFDALPELLVRMYAEGYRVREMPFHYQPRKSGRSHARLFRFGLSFLGTLLRMRRLRTSVSSADYDMRAFDSRIPLQRYWQRKRYRLVMSLLDREGRVLDVGCGSSRIIVDLPQAVGMDVQLRKLRYLRDMVLMLIAWSLSRLPFRDECFREVVCSEVNEHVPREQVKLSEFHRVIKPGGTLILGTPDYSSWIWRTIERVYGWVHPGGYTDEHINPYTRDSLQRELEENGFTIENVKFICRSEMVFKARRT